MIKMRIFHNKSKLTLLYKAKEFRFKNYTIRSCGYKNNDS